MDTAKRKHSNFGVKPSNWVIGLSPAGQKHEYFINGVTYEVESRFEPRKESHTTVRNRFERIVKNDSASLTVREDCGKIMSEYDSAVGKEMNEKDSN